MTHKTPYIAPARACRQPPYYDTKPAWWMARELGLRTGLEKWFKWETVEEYLDERLASIGSSIEKMRDAAGRHRPEGQALLRGLQGRLALPHRLGQDRVLLARTGVGGAGPACPPTSRSRSRPRASIRLLYGRHPVHTFAKTQNTPLLSELYPENELWINAERAAAPRAWRTAHACWLENQDGARSGPIKVKVTERIRPDAVYMVAWLWPELAGADAAPTGKGASDACADDPLRARPHQRRGGHAHQLRHAS